MEKITVVYNKVGNTLDVWFGKPRKAICEELGNGFILKKDEKGEVLGFEKLNYVKKSRPLSKLPVEVVVS
jgi:hypothetical protein